MSHGKRMRSYIDITSFIAPTASAYSIRIHIHIHIHIVAHSCT
jgi:hypothetical protein